MLRELRQWAAKLNERLGWPLRSEAHKKWAEEDKQIDVASEDSFPASDPPSWTPTDGAHVKRKNA